MSAGVSSSIECILCNAKFKGKGARGSCKRHLENQHIAPASFQRRTCNDTFSTRNEVKSHCNKFCPSDIGWRRTTKDRSLYGCEFTGKCFTDHSKYADHLLRLCEAPALEKPDPSSGRKLFALLEHPLYHEYIQGLSASRLGNPDGWKSLPWNQKEAEEAAAKLEYYSHVSSGNPSDGMALCLRTFLEALVFSQSKYATCEPASSGPHAIYPLHSSFTHDVSRSQNRGLGANSSMEALEAGDDRRRETDDQQLLLKTMHANKPPFATLEGEQAVYHSNHSTFTGSHSSLPRNMSSSGLYMPTFTWPTNDAYNINGPGGFPVLTSSQQHMEAATPNADVNDFPYWRASLALQTPHRSSGLDSAEQQLHSLHPPMVFDAEEQHLPRTYPQQAARRHQEPSGAQYSPYHRRE